MPRAHHLILRTPRSSGKLLLMSAPSVPASEHHLMLFCAYLALQGLKWKTIKSYLSAVHHFQLMQRAPSGSLDEPQPRLQLILRGIKRATSIKPTKARPTYHTLHPQTGLEDC